MEEGETAGDWNRVLFGASGKPAAAAASSAAILLKFLVGVM